MDTTLADDTDKDDDGDGEEDDSDSEEVEAPKCCVVHISFKLRTKHSNFTFRTGSTMPRMASSSKIFP